MPTPFHLAGNSAWLSSARYRTGRADFLSGDAKATTSSNGGGGANTILGGAGDDTIFASGLGESLDGGAGVNTYVYVGADWALIDLGTGLAGTVVKAGVTDAIANFQAVFASPGNDTLKGTNNADTLGGGRGNDNIDGRGGFDMVDYGTFYGAAPTGGAIVNLSSGAITVGGIVQAGNTGRDGWGTTDTLSNIEGAIGTGFADTLIGRTGGSAPSRLEGGAGDDSLAGGNLSNIDTLGGANTILGGAGNDLIQANGFKEILQGGEGIDTLIYRGTGSVTIDLGTDNSGPDGYKGFLSVYSNQTVALGFERAYASTGSDTLKGSNGDDTLSGDAGSDLIDGRAGFNTLDYGSSFVAAPTLGAFVNLSGVSQTLGGAAVAAGTARDGWGATDTLVNIHGVIGTGLADSMVGSNLDNRFSGGDGADFLNGSGGNDTLLGGAADDTLRGGDGNDSIDAGLGNDIVVAGLGSDTIEGGAPSERNSIDYRTTIANVSGINGGQYAGGPLQVAFADGTSATVTKSDGVDTLHNINLIYGTGNADRFNLAAVGADAPMTIVVRGGAGNDTVTGNGTDRVVADFNGSTAAINVNLATGVAADGQGGVDSLVNVRAIISSFGGNDTLTGSGADETFIGSGLGSKSITGGGGNDTYRYQGNSGVAIDLGTSNAGGAYLGNVSHGGATDTINGFDRGFGGNGADTIKGTNGSDTLGGDAGADVLDGRDGADLVDYSIFNATPIAAGVFVNLSLGSQTAPGGVTLEAGTAKDPWGAIGNDTVLNFEGAIGTGFADTLVGTNFADVFSGNGGDDNISSGGGADTLMGGAGDDSLRGGNANDVIDGGAGWDVAVYSGVLSTAATWSRNPTTGAWTVTSSDGTDTLTNVEALRFSDRRVDFAKAIPDDVTGNGTSDILWRGSDGSVAVWAMKGLTGEGATLPNAPAGWVPLGTGDFNGDGWADLLWRQSTGALATWYSGAGGFTGGGGVIATVDPAWKVAATGDMNRDGRTDILWRHVDGSVALWEMDGTVVIGGGSLGTVDPAWSIVGLADFSDDGRADIVWRNVDGTVAVWLMDGTSVIGGGTVYNPGAAWKVAGLGDFDGDGKADLLWRNDDGAISVWTMNGNAVLATGGLGNPGVSWKVAKVADYNGDGHADILWHHADGSVALWLMNGFAATATGTLGNAGSWMIV